MGFPFAFVFLVLFHLPLVLSSEDNKSTSQISCPKLFNCGSHGNISFPFANSTHHSCGLIIVYCDKPVLRIQPASGIRAFEVQGGSLMADNNISLLDTEFLSGLDDKSCEHLEPLFLPNSTSISFTISHNITLFKCKKNPTLDQQTDEYFHEYLGANYQRKICSDDYVYYRYPNDTSTSANYAQLPSNCYAFFMPRSMNDTSTKPDDIFSLLSANFILQLHVTPICIRCHSRGGRCAHDSSLTFRCDNSKQKGKNTQVILISVFSGVGGAILLCLLFIYWRRRKWSVKAYMLSRNTSSDPSSKADPEVGESNVYFNVPVFTYKELEEATANFDSSKELGDGGFGTVYYGKLKDGREVAVKKLYENNYKRVQQFMNEIEILTRLRHRNLVTLYGCTSRHSRELILVYEYISNGTVADHLHKNGAEPGSSSLPWSIRLNIAIETATALAYLHASKIVHRDVKTNNILLDSNFCVKVADFGLSRLFPNDVTHVSTAPQGTPGYVDPEYHQCYQLTDKSDVYSFGVVLIELISSMPAVDITRHKHEINLANLAINRIQKCAFSELIDSSIGFESDESVKRMTITVAELAFLCLQQEKEMRPTMDKVLETLKEIVGETEDITEINSSSRVDGSDSIELFLSSQPPPSPESDDAVLLKNKNSVVASPEITLAHKCNINASDKF